MLHQRIPEANVAAAAWPAGLESLILAQPVEPEQDEVSSRPEPMAFQPAAPDVAGAVGGLIVSAYAALVLVFFAFFTGSAQAAFAVAISAGFVAIFFTVPRIFFALEPDEKCRPSMSDFMDRGIDTLTGHSSGRDALLQMLIVPVMLTFGLLAIGIVGAIYL